MAVSANRVQVTWPTAANSTSVSSSGNATSEEPTLSDTAFMRTVTLKADNDGTPASGDTISFYAMYTNGDPDGASTDEFDTAAHAELLAVLDTNGEDPAIKTVELLVTKGLKLYAVNDSSGRAITVSAEIEERTG